MNRSFCKGIAGLSSLYKPDVFLHRILHGNFSPIVFSAIESPSSRVFFHSSSIKADEVVSVPTRMEELRQEKKEDVVLLPIRPDVLRKIYRKPVDWLPFEWHRRLRFNPFKYSCDLVKEMEFDPSWPKPDFELSDELKTASDSVKHIFSLATACKAEIRETVKRNILKRVQRHPNDFDSFEVRIALDTIRIRSLFQHQREYKKDTRNGRFILDILINRRNGKLGRLYRMDRDRFNWLVKELQLYYEPGKVGGGTPPMYNKKWDIRRMTKTYCQNLEKEKKAAYHEELKQQQADFLKEKEELLAWIEKEEKELENLKV